MPVRLVSQFSRRIWSERRNTYEKGKHLKSCVLGIKCYPRQSPNYVKEKKRGRSQIRTEYSRSPHCPIPSGTQEHHAGVGNTLISIRLQSQLKKTWTPISLEKSTNYILYHWDCSAMRSHLKKLNTKRNSSNCHTQHCCVFLVLSKILTVTTVAIQEPTWVRTKHFLKQRKKLFSTAAWNKVMHCESMELLFRL